MNKKRYVMTWRNKWLTAEAESLEDMIETFAARKKELEEMLKDGIALDTESGIGDDYAILFTYDKSLAKKYDFEDEDEFNEFIEEEEAGDDYGDESEEE